MDSDRTARTSLLFELTAWALIEIDPPLLIEIDPLSA